MAQGRVQQRHKTACKRQQGKRDHARAREAVGQPAQPGVGQCVKQSRGQQNRAEYREVEPCDLLVEARHMHVNRQGCKRQRQRQHAIGQHALGAHGGQRSLEQRCAQAGFAGAWVEPDGEEGAGEGGIVDLADGLFVEEKPRAVRQLQAHDAVARLHVGKQRQHLLTPGLELCIAGVKAAHLVHTGLCDGFAFDVALVSQAQRQRRLGLLALSRPQRGFVHKETKAAELTTPPRPQVGQQCRQCFGRLIR